MGELLLTNTTLTDLQLIGDNRKNKSNILSLIAYLTFCTGNSIKDDGAAVLSEVLKTNTTLKKLILTCLSITK